MGIVPEANVARRLCLVWGVHAVVSADTRSMGDAVTRARKTGAGGGVCQAWRCYCGGGGNTVRDGGDYQFVAGYDS